MILYVVNLLYDNIKKKIEIINKDSIQTKLFNDARYIAEFAGIKKTTNIYDINSGLINIGEIIKRYNVCTVDALDVLQIILGNRNNNWIIKRCFKESLENNGNEVILTKVVNDIIERDRNAVLENLENLSDDLRMLILKTIFVKIKEENQRAVSMQRLNDAS